MALTMTASSLMGSKVTAPQRTAAPRRAAAPVSATLRSDVARFAKAAGVSAASLALALSAQAAEVKLGQDGGGLVSTTAHIAPACSTDWRAGLASLASI